MSTQYNSKVKDVLIKARAEIEKPENWTKGWFARDANGQDTDSGAPEAVCFCTTGAINRVTRVLGPFTQYRVAANRVLAPFMGGNIPHYNDSHTHAEVLAKFDEAINSIVV